MSALIDRFILFACVSAAACQAVPAPASRAPHESLRELARAPNGAGAVVYRGEVRPLQDRSGPAVFRYERRVRDEGRSLISTHLTRRLDGSPVVAQTAEHSAAYELTRFEVLQDQTGTSGDVTVAPDGRLHFSVRTARSRRLRSEPAGPAVVVGPTLFGYVAAHWDELAKGRALRVRFAVLERARTYGFVLRLASTSPSTTVFTFSASSPLVRASVRPMRLVFDTGSRKIVRYEGRVPPMLERNGRLRPLDARVDYTFVAAEYR